MGSKLVSRLHKTVREELKSDLKYFYQHGMKVILKLLQSNQSLFCKRGEFKSVRHIVTTGVHWHSSRNWKYNSLKNYKSLSQIWACELLFWKSEVWKCLRIVYFLQQEKTEYYKEKEENKEDCRLETMSCLSDGFLIVCKEKNPEYYKGKRGK